MVTLWFRALHIGLGVGWVLVLWAPASGATLNVSPSKVYQGNAFLVILQADGEEGVPQARFRDQAIHFTKMDANTFAAIGNVEQKLEPDTYTLTATVGGRTYESPLTVISRDFPVERLTLPERQVSLSEEDLKRVRSESARLTRLWPRVSGIRWSLPFQLPVQGTLGTTFGTRRILNGQEKNPHNGQDIKAPKGTPVRAISGGTVALCEDQFFGGNTLVIDHGGGLFSFYMHLDEFLVQEGDVVDSGNVIASVGSTGRSTGPHLHVGMKLGGVNLNPLSLVDLKLP